MTLDEAIKHCEEKAEELYCKADEDYFFDGDWGKKLYCTECAKEHEQLAEWLKELKGLRLLAEWAVQCGFGYDNIPEEYERYKNIISDLDYIEGLIYIAKKEAE